MRIPRFKTILLGFTIFLVATLAIASSFTLTTYFQLQSEMNSKLATKSFLQPTEYYVHRGVFREGTRLSFDQLKGELLREGFRERSHDQQLFEKDFASFSPEVCSRLIGEGALTPEKSSSGFISQLFTSHPERPAISSCLAVNAPKNAFFESRNLWFVFTEENSILRGIFEGAQSPTKKAWTSLGVEPVAQYLGNEPISQEVVDLGQIPVACLQGVLAIEDREFLEHKGFSLWNIFRAGVTSTLGYFRGRRAHGGSTITQQLVKNYFLTHERTLERKYKELLLSIALERRLSKDEILNLYLNVIYMGQNGPFQVRGFAAASKFYFDQPISSLNLPQCAFLAAVLNSPGLFNPWSKHERALSRRNLVLEKMLEVGQISKEEKEAAVSTPLVVVRKNEPFETAPYFLEGAREQLQKLGLDVQNKRILTTLDLTEQRVAQDSMTQRLSLLEKDVKKVSQLAKQGKNLEAVILASDNNGRITTHIGGRSFRSTQFNRALKAHRQVGSLFKPLVYLKALELGSWNSFSLLKNESIEMKVSGRNWKPQNYDRKTSDPLPLYLALANSLNLPVVHLTNEIGAESVIELAQSFGVESILTPVPSLALGSFELYPYEVLKIYLGFANLGFTPELTWIDRVQNAEGETLYEFHESYIDSASKESTSKLVSILATVPRIGTAKVLKGLTNTSIEFAGKTGTTNDYKDSWFVGFTPRKTALVWVGYDDNSVSGLTGASGAAPLWGEFMKSYFDNSIAESFVWPDGLEAEEVTVDSEILKILK